MKVIKKSTIRADLVELRAPSNEQNMPKLDGIAHAVIRPPKVDIFLIMFNLLQFN